MSKACSAHTVLAATCQLLSQVKLRPLCSGQASPRPAGSPLWSGKNRRNHHFRGEWNLALLHLLNFLFIRFCQLWVSWSVLRNHCLDRGVDHLILPLAHPGYGIILDLPSGVQLQGNNCFGSLSGTKLTQTSINM